MKQVKSPKQPMLPLSEKVKAKLRQDTHAAKANSLMQELLDNLNRNVVASQPKG